MKIFLLLIIGSLVMSLSAQDTLFYDSDWDEVSSSTSAFYYKVVLKDGLDTNKAQVLSYYVTGEHIRETNYSNYNEKTVHGKNVWYFKSGQLRGERQFINGNVDGVFKTYWSDGTVKRQDLYQNDKWVEGTCYNENGEKIKYYPYEISAMFPKGQKGMMKFLVKEIRYPDNAIENKIEGKVLLKFIITEEGYVINVKVINSVNEELDAEAVRAVSEMPKWKPAMEDGETVRSYFNLPVNFKLHEVFKMTD